MLQRLYVHNFKCLENFELKLNHLSSALLIGDNGTGKSAIAQVLEILQSLGRGQNQISELVQLQDFTRGQVDIPMRLEIEVLLAQHVYKYVITFASPAPSQALRIEEEQLWLLERPIYLRQGAEITLSAGDRDTQFQVDWQLAALPILQAPEGTPLFTFRSWLTRMVILSPIPALMTGQSVGETLALKRDGSNFAAWCAGLLSRYPAAYTQADHYLRSVMPDIQDFRNEPTGKNTKSMAVYFKCKKADLSVSFTNLSDGEKCFFLCALVLAANQYDGPLFCFWDEIDTHLSLSEVGHFVVALRRAFQMQGQFLATSHHAEVIHRFSDENTFLLARNSHLAPTRIQPLTDLAGRGDRVGSLIRGDL